MIINYRQISPMYWAVVALYLTQSVQKCRAENFFLSLLSLSLSSSFFHTFIIFIIILLSSIPHLHHHQPENDRATNTDGGTHPEPHSRGMVPDEVSHLFIVGNLFALLIRLIKRWQSKCEGVNGFIPFVWFDFSK